MVFNITIIIIIITGLFAATNNPPFPLGKRGPFPFFTTERTDYNCFFHGGPFASHKNNTRFLTPIISTLNGTAY